MISEFFSHSEYDTVINSVLNMYKVNIKKVFTYAKRRNLSDKLEKYVNKQYTSEVNKCNFISNRHKYLSKSMQLIDKCIDLL